MTIHIGDDRSGGIGRLFENLADGAGAMLDRFHRRLTANRTRRILQELPDHILRDIGVTRGEIWDLSRPDGAAAQHHWRNRR